MVSYVRTTSIMPPWELGKLSRQAMRSTSSKNTTRLFDSRWVCKALLTLLIKRDVWHTLDSYRRVAEILLGRDCQRRVLSHQDR